MRWHLFGFLAALQVVVAFAVACTSSGSTPILLSDGGDSATVQNDAEASIESSTDCGLGPVACKACISQKCCPYENFCSGSDPHCAAYGLCISACSLDAAACDCYTNFADLVAKDKLRGDCEIHQCLEAGLCN